MIRKPDQFLPAIANYAPMMGFSAWFYFCAVMMIAGGSLVMCLMAVVFREKQKRERFLQRMIITGVRQLFALNKEWHVSYEGLDKLSADDQFIIVANHQSVLDPFVLYALPFPFTWVVKRWVFGLPCLGLALKLCGHIPAEPRKALPACRKALASGLSLVIFPEGTRSPNGLLQPFKMGAFRLSTESGLRILPVVIDGTGQILPKYRKILGRKALVRIRVLDPLCPTTFNANPEWLRREVYNLMAEELDEMRGAERIIAVQPGCL